MAAAAPARRRKPIGGAKGRSAAPPSDPTTAYARAVVAGKVVAGRLVRLACERHLRDVKNQKALGLEWRPWREQGKRRGAAHALDFFPGMLALDTDGEVPFTLHPWQAFVVGSVFGWYKSDGFRRFRTAYVETGKGSGKTPLAAGVGLYMMVADGESAPEVYSAATMKDQAKIVWKDAHRMVCASKELADLVQHPDNAEVQAGALVIPGDTAVFRAVSSEHKGLDGKRVHCALIDELHEHPSNIVVEKMRAGVKNQRNALIFEITNSGVDRASVCWQHHELSVKVVEQTVRNEAWFAYVCGLDEGDEWTDEKVWPKANPSLPALPSITYLREQVTDALTMPSKQNIVKRLNTCIWTEQVERWLMLEQWDAKACAAPVDVEGLAGERVFVGLDMSSPQDLCAAAFVFGPDDGGAHDVVMRLWLPEDALGLEGHQDDRQRQLRAWADAGLITLTDGGVCDYDRIEAELLQELGKYGLGAVGFNPSEMRQMSTHLIEELGKEKVLQTTQSFASISEACKYLEALVAKGLLRHGGDPVLRWTAAQVSVQHGPNEQVRIDREKSIEKVAIAALVTALAQFKKTPGEADYYEGRGLVTI